jgi:hypothetical protein
MDRRNWILAPIALLAASCSTRATGDETHFLCSADADCKRLSADSICQIGRCVAAPDGYPTLGDGGVALSLPMSDDPGPAADCTEALPDNAASFETTARRLPPTTLAPDWPTSGQEPISSASGGAIVFGAGTHEVPASPVDSVQGHLVRWVGDSLTWLGQPEDGVLFPGAMSCDGSTIVGRVSNPSVTVRWSRERAYETAPAGILNSIAPAGDALFGFELTSEGVATAVKWPDGAAPEVLFELPEPMSGRAWSRGGDAFLYGTFQLNTSDELFVKVGAAEPFPVTLSLDDSCAIVIANTVSTQGRVVGGAADCRSDGFRYFVWTASGGTQKLPQYASMRAITPGGVAMGEFARISPPRPDGPIYRGFVWDLRNGLRFLDELLAEHGVTVPQSVSITTVTSASDDARVFTGTCIDERDPGRKNVFRAVLPAGVFD